MASYVPNHRKKSIKLTRKESNLRRLLAQGASLKKLLDAASEVRESRVRVVRSRLSENPQGYVERSVIQKAEQKIASIRNTPLEAILSEFRCLTDERSSPRSP